MSAATFVATHCGARFVGAEGAAALAAHMQRQHGRTPVKPGKNFYHVGNAPGWARGGILPPTPWTAPKRTATPEQVAAKWRDEVEYVDLAFEQREAA